MVDLSPYPLNQLLLWKHKFTGVEILTVREVFAEQGFDGIPPINIRISLTALIAAESKAENINDHIDIMLLSSGLAVSVLLFTDKQRKFELERTGLAAKYQAKIYSGSPKDLELFLAEITNL